MAPNADDATAPPLPAATASTLTALLERIWARIRSFHPDVPDAVVVLGASSDRGRSVILGHFSAARWSRKVDGGKRERKSEVMIAAELFRRLEDVLEVLLHEAVHGIANTRQIQDTSRQGRYHNKAYKDLAAEVGLFCTKTVCGWSETTLAPSATERYKTELAELAAIHESLGNARRIGRGMTRNEGKGEEEGEEEGEGKDEDEGEGEGKGKGKKGSANKVALRCKCEPPLVIYMSAGQVERHPITCGGCGGCFQPKSKKPAEAEAAEAAEAA